MSIINGTAENDTLIGTDAADQMYGFEGDDSLEGGLGDDQLDGGSAWQGGDTASYSTAASAVSVDLILGKASGGAGNDTLTEIENIIGSQYNDTLIGNADVNTPYGGRGNDILDGGAGNDSLNDGSGNDTYVFGRGSGQDTVIDYDDTLGNLDTVQLGAGIVPADVTISRDLSNLYVKINTTTDQLTLSNWFGSDDYKIEQVRFADGTTVWDAATLLGKTQVATDGDDYLSGDSGANTLSGLKGNDTYFVDNVGDVIHENPGEGVDNVQANISYKLPANVENLSLTGTAAINGAGNELNNILYGNSANNILDGGAGNDYLNGGYGGGKAGTDNDTYLFGLGSGQDTVFDYNSTQGNNDSVQLGPGIAPTDVTISRDLSNLTIKINATPDQLTLTNWFASDDYKIEHVKFANGIVWDVATLLANINWRAPTLSGFASTVANGNEDSGITVTFDNLQTQGNEANGDGTVTSFTIKAVSSGNLKIGTSAGTAMAWAAGANDRVDVSHMAFWTPATNANGTLNAFTAVARDNVGSESASAIQATIAVTAVNDAPTLTAFAAPIATGNQNSQITITYDKLQNQGDEADVDGTVTAFVIKAISSGALKIGSSPQTATAWATGTNDVVDDAHQAYWTPAANANGTLNAFTAVAKDNGGLESASAMQAIVAVDAPDTSTPTVTITDNLSGTANTTTGSIAYSLAFSEAVTGLEANDFIVTKGSVSSVSGSGSAWIVNVIPEQGVSDVTIGLTLKAGAVSDGAGNLNAGVTDPSQAIDTIAPVAPKLVTNAAFNFLIDPRLTMQTSLGTVVYELNPERAPVTVANMLAYANTGFYDNTLFHRVISGFMVQGGGFTSGLNYKTPDYGPIVLESNNGLANLRGTIAMARTSDPNSATSQFFVNLVDNGWQLDYGSYYSPAGYAVFGKVVSGMPVIDSIAHVPIKTVGDHVPITDVTITSVQQTLAGSSITNVGTLAVSGLETGAQWSYSLDSGATWTVGAGNSITVPVGSYEADAIQVRQTDTAGNVSASTGKLTSALVVDTTAPTITSFSPAGGAAAVDIGSNLVLSLSEPIQAGTGNFIIYNANGTVAKTIAVTDSSQVSISGSTVTINPTSDLTGSSSYYVTLSAGVIKDLAGNNFAGISDTTAYTFSTVNNAAPTLSAFAATVAGGNEDSPITVTFASLQNQGDEVDVDGSVTAFVIKAISSGALKIGGSAGSATAWNPVTNNTVDTGHQAYWTPAANANGLLNAFTAVAKDNGGAESATAIQAKVAVTATNDVHTGTVSQQGSTIVGQTLTASHTLADLDGLGAVNYQWQASTDGSNWSAINGATANTLQLTRAQAGQFVRMHASYTDGAGTPESQDSAAGNKVTAPYQVISGSHGNDVLAGTTADDGINGGFGFDTVRETGALSDYSISQSGKSVILTRTVTGERDVFTDIERVTFDSGNNLTIAYTEAEAVARHLMTHWLHRDLSVFEGGYVIQHLSTYSATEIANVFLTLPEASGLANKSAAELLAGYESHPLMQRLSAVREVKAGDGNDQITVSFGVSVNVDSGHGHDIVTINEALANINVAVNGSTLELSRHADGAMLDLKNVEMIALVNGETVAIAHDPIEGILGRLIHTFFDRNASVQEWQLGRDALALHIAPDDILNWFQDHAGLKQLNDSDYIQTLFQNTFNRAATASEQNDYLTQLHNGSLDRSWLAVDLALSQEAVTVIGSQVVVMDGWM